MPTQNTSRIEKIASLVFFIHLGLFLILYFNQNTFTYSDLQKSWLLMLNLWQGSAYTFVKINVATKKYTYSWNIFFVLFCVPGLLIIAFMIYLMMMPILGKPLF